uniref:S1 family peptidase n=1 Tax=Thaumasiovibrio occultus TaxID=1891184 RepID=UPI00131BC1A8|nr:serine protease [Thaumasiovibrio occultus]
MATRLLLPLYFLVFSVSALEIEPRVIGGIESGENDVPWQLYVSSSINGSSFGCGATYIGNRYALSAAHCFFEGAQRVSLENVKVWGGTVDSQDFISASAVTLESLVIHPDFNPQNYENDIAVLRLSREINNAIPIQLISVQEQVTANNDFANGYNASGFSPENLLVSGWGDTSVSGENFPRFLQQTLLTGVPDFICDEEWGNRSFGTDLAKLVCADSPNPLIGRDSCSGDSGSPLVWQNASNAADRDFGLRLMGIVSFGITSNGQSCVTGLPSGYTEIAAFLPFIQVNSDSLPSASNFSVDPFSLDYSEAGEINVTIPDSDDGGAFSFFGLLILFFIGLRRARPKC